MAVDPGKGLNLSHHAFFKSFIVFIGVKRAANSIYLGSQREALCDMRRASIFSERSYQAPMFALRLFLSKQLLHLGMCGAKKTHTNKLFNEVSLSSFVVFATHRNENAPAVSIEWDPVWKRKQASAGPCQCIMLFIGVKLGSSTSLLLFFCTADYIFFINNVILLVIIWKKMWVRHC